MNIYKLPLRLKTTSVDGEGVISTKPAVLKCTSVLYFEATYAINQPNNEPNHEECVNAESDIEEYSVDGDDSDENEDYDLREEFLRELQSTDFEEIRCPILTEIAVDFHGIVAEIHPQGNYQPIAGLEQDTPGASGIDDDFQFAVERLEECRVALEAGEHAITDYRNSVVSLQTDDWNIEQEQEESK